MLSHRDANNVGLLIVLSLLFLTIQPSLSLSEENREVKRGYNGQIGKAEMRSILERGEFIEGHVIQGEDLTSLLGEERYDIRVESSIIEGRLSFYELPSEKLTEILLPVDWTAEKQKEFIDKRRMPYTKSNCCYLKSALDEEEEEEEEEEESFTEERTLPDIHIVLNNIIIKNTEINSHVNSSFVFYYGTVDFSESIFKKGVNFDCSAFFRGAKFFSATFNKGASFALSDLYAPSFLSTTFNGKVDFYRASIINSLCWFHKATFNGPTQFVETYFGSLPHFSSLFTEISFKGAAFNHPVTFECSVFQGQAFFVRARFKGRADFWHTTFQNNAKFQGAIFENGVGFEQAEFHRCAYFDEAVFHENVAFTGTDFKGTASFSQTRFKKVAYFPYAAFHTALVLAHAEIERNADFRQAKINKLDLNCAENAFIVRGYLDFRNASIQKAFLRDVTFEKKVDFSQAKFGDPTAIEGSLFFSPDYFPLPAVWKNWILQLQKNCSSKEMNVSRLILKTIDSETSKEISGFTEDRTLGVDLLQKIISSVNTLLTSKTFYTPEYFKDVELTYELREMLRKPQDQLSDIQVVIMNRALLWTAYPDHGPLFHLPSLEIDFATFKDDVLFQDAVFYGSVFFQRVSFGRVANFVDTDFKNSRYYPDKIFVFSHVNFKELYIRWDQLPDPDHWYKGRNLELAYSVEPKSRVLKKLEDYFVRNEMLSDSNQAYYYRKKTELEEERKSQPLWKTLPKGTLFEVYRVTCGYGTKISWLIVWYLSIYLASVMIYCLGKLERHEAQKPEKDSTFKICLADMPGKYLTKQSSVPTKSPSGNKFFNALLLSFVLLFKIRCRDITISGKGMLLVLWVEWSLGILFIVALIATTRKSLPFLGSLLSVIF